jgi:hypothetical protein
LLLATLAFVEDGSEAVAVVSRLAAAVPSGSYVAIWHLASGFDPMLEGAVRRWNATATQRMRLRSRSQVADLVAGLELVPPGLVPVMDWRPALDDPCFENPVPVYGLVARKP